MAWIVRLTEVSDAEMVSSQLWDLGTSGVAETVSDGCTTLVAGFDTRSVADRVAAALGGTVEKAQSHWVNAQPTVLTVAGHTLRINSGQAFGHGNHPTTALVLDALADLMKTRRATRVLDAGTGTGILALAAALLGATDVYGFDADPSAVEVAKGNAQLNGLNASFGTDLTATAPGIGGERFDLILANVLLPVHKALAAPLLQRLSPSGALVASGTTQDQQGELEATYSDLRPSEVRNVEQWTCTVLSGSDVLIDV